MIKDYIIAVLGVALLVTAGFAYLQTGRLSIEKREHALFVKTTKQIGEAAQRAAAKRIEADKKAKGKADEENRKTIAGLRADNKRLRDERARSGYVPPAAPGARRPDLATFDRAELERALQFLDAGVQEIVGEGDESRVNLDTGKHWIKDQRSRESP